MDALENEMAQTFFAVTIPGLEALLQAELRTLGAKKCQVEHGGVSFRATRAKSYHILQQTHQANRIYLRLDEFRSRDIFELYRKTQRMDWSSWLKAGSVVTIDASMSKSNFGGTGEIADKVHDGIRDSMKGAKLAVSFDDKAKDAIRILVRVTETRCIISLDLSGRALYQRGWRKRTGRAPLRESTASSLLAAIGWSNEPLIDPMCGSGTFLIEAARQAAGMSPRTWQEYAVQQHANYDSESWPDISVEALPGKDEVHLFGYDRDADAVKVAHGNSQAAGVDTMIKWSARETEKLIVPERLVGQNAGVIICNPPFNRRIDRTKGRDAPDQKLLHRFARQEFAGWRLGLLVPADFTIEHDGLVVEELLRFRAGGVPVRFWKITHAT